MRCIQCGDDIEMESQKKHSASYLASIPHDKAAREQRRFRNGSRSSISATSAVNHIVMQIVSAFSVKKVSNMHQVSE